MKQILLVALAIIILARCSGPKNERSIVLGDTIQTSSGLKYLYTKVGTGRPVETGSKVWTYLALSVNGQEIWNTNEMKDSSFVFVANKDRMIKGFTEVTMKLHEGDEIVAILPPDIAYGERGSGSVIPPNSTLVYTRYIMKKVSEPKLSLSDTLFAAYKNGGHERMVSVRNRVLSSKDTAGYYYDDGQYRILWNLLNDAEMHEENLRLIDFVNTTNEAGWRWYRVRTYQRMGNFALALDSLNTLMSTDTTMASSDRAMQLKSELLEKLK